MSLNNWKFRTAEGLVLDEHQSYPDDIRITAKDLNLPDNSLSYAKVTIYNEDLHGIVFCIDDIELPIPEDQILGFTPFIRCVSDGLSSGSDAGEMLYLLDGKEYPLKKNSTSSGVTLSILDKLKRLNSI
jgi:hypothetical protein